MRKLRTAIMTALPMLLLAISGCTRAASTPQQAQLSTLVAATLAARPTEAPSHTPTTAPSATAMVLPSATATLPPSISPTPTVTEPPFDDPREGRQLAPADSHDDFDPPVAWYTFSNSDAAVVAQDGQLAATDERADFLVWWSISDQTGDDSYVEVTARFGECEGKDAAGLALRVNGSQGYVIEYACDASFRVRKFRAGRNPDVLLDWTSTQGIHSGSMAINRLGAMMEGNHLWVFANGNLLTEDPITDEGFESGAFALFASAAETPGFTVTFDKFDYWDLSP
jgi:hypothetical protein